jgi:hypothetical protein
MKYRLTVSFHLAAITLFCAFTLLLPAPAVFAANTNAPLRVTSWNFGPKPAANTDVFTEAYEQKLIYKGAESLKKLNPDVILLQQIASQQDCQLLVEALKPEVYHIVICSSFWDAHAEKPGSRQVAIIAKSSAQQAWAEPWQINGSAAADGLAFADLQIGSQNIGFFTVQVADDALADASENDFTTPAEEEQQELILNQLTHHIDALHRASSNAIPSLVLGGDFNANDDSAKFFRRKIAATLKHIGFAHAFPGRNQEKNGRPNAADCILIRNVGKPSNLQVSPVPAISRYRPATCDLDLDIAPAPQPAPVVAEKKEAKAPAPAAVIITPAAISPAPLIAKASPPPVPAPNNSNSTKIIGAAAVLFFLLVGFLWFLFRPRAAKGNALTVTHNNPSALGAAQQMPAGFVTQFNSWLKQRFVQRLVSDRSQLLRVQDAATAKILAVDERLANVEKQIQSQTQDYEHRIAVLQKELSYAKEENRELIKAQIALLQMEMAKAQLKSRTPLN